jgi:flagellar hook-associated protein 1 FlgK
MAGLLGVLDSASRALAVNSLGIQTTSHNIANVETEGYSRQRQIRGTMPPSEHPAGHLGTGVEQLTVRRITDPFLQGQMIRQGSLFGSADAQAQALSVVQEVFNEQSAGGLGSSLNAFYDAFSDLASSPSPGAPVEREGVRTSALRLIDTIHALDSQLRAEQHAANDSIESYLSDINRLTSEIGKQNDEIVRLEATAPANDARDRRDLLVRELAQLVDIQSYEDGAGRLNVSLTSGMPLVEGSSARELRAVPDPANPFDPSFVQIHHVDGALSVDVTAGIGGGRLGGTLRARDTLIAGAIRTLDTLAYNLASTVNSIHTAGVGLNGASGDFFAVGAAVEDAAQALQLSAGVAASTDAIAAGLSTAPSDNRNALALAALRTGSSPVYLPGDPPGPPTGPSRSVLEHLSVIVTDVGEQARVLDSARSQQGRILENLENRRDQVSGVSLDEEMTQLIELQAAFQANSRIVRLVDELLADVLDIL